MLTADADSRRANMVYSRGKLWNGRTRTLRLQELKATLLRCPGGKMFTVSITAFIVCSLAALFGGFIDAISGGGGLLTIPALLVCGVPAHMALGTNKAGAVLGTTTALCNFARHGMVNWRMAAIGVPFSLVGSWLGSLLALYLDANVLGKIIVVLLPLSMLATLLPSKRSGTTELRLSGARLWLLLPLVCTLLGCYDGFFGPGTGSFLILALHWFLRMNLMEASANAKAFNLASNISAAVSFIWHGAVVWALGIPMAVAYMAGNWLGSAFAIKVGPGAVRKFLFISLGLLMVSLIWRYFLAPMFQ